MYWIARGEILSFRSLRNSAGFSSVRLWRYFAYRESQEGLEYGSFNCDLKGWSLLADRTALFFVVD